MNKLTDNFILTEEQKALANEEFKKFNEDPNYGLDWDEVKIRLGIEDDDEIEED
jgi:hypothetical protein